MRHQPADQQQPAACPFIDGNRLATGYRLTLNKRSGYKASTHQGNLRKQRTLFNCERDPAAAQNNGSEYLPTKER